MIAWIIEWICRYVSPAAGPDEAFAISLAVRSLLAGTALAVLSSLCGPAAIRWLSRHCREPIKSGSAQLDRLHAAKASTPTMGGLFLIAGIFSAVLALSDLTNRTVILALVVTAGLSLTGAIDDFIKLRTTGAGLSWKQKLCAQIAVAALPAVCFYGGWCDVGGGPWGIESGQLLVAADGGTAGGSPAVVHALAWTVIPWTVLVIVATSNAVNITDGLDGLAAGCLLLPTLAVALATYVTRDGTSRELVIVAAAAIGGVLGFLPFNRHPARVFMGNVGALPLGGLLGFLAVATGTELLLLFAGGVFVAEAASVLLQIGYYRTAGKRIFRCAPLHHHFEFAGWPEKVIVKRFWAASAVCAAVGLALALALSSDANSHPASRVREVAANSAAMRR